MPANETPSFFRTLGEFFGLLAGDLGRAIAIFGGLWVGFLCISKAQEHRVNDWVYLTIAGGVFLCLILLCRKRN